MIAQLFQDQLLILPMGTYSPHSVSIMTDGELYNEFFSTLSRAVIGTVALNDIIPAMEYASQSALHAEEIHNNSAPGVTLYTIATHFMQSDYTSSLEQIGIDRFHCVDLRKPHLARFYVKVQEDNLRMLTEEITYRGQSVSQLARAAWNEHYNIR